MKPSTQTIVTTPAQALVAMGTLLAAQGKIPEGVACVLLGAGLTWVKLRTNEKKE